MDAKSIADQILPVLRDGAKELWDGPEDAEFLKEMALEIGKLRARKIAGDDSLDFEIKVVEETVKQRAMQKEIRLNGLGEQILPKIIGMAAKIGLALL